MKRLTFFTLAALFAAMTATAAYAQIKYVAVVETEVDAQSGAAKMLNKAEVRQITAVLRNEARNNLSSGKYKIMTAETVIAQGSAKLEECAEENCVIALGNKIGADYIVRGIVSKFGTELTLSVEMYETEDGTLMGSSRVSSEKPKVLLEKATVGCVEMYKKFEAAQESTTHKASTAQQTPMLSKPAVVAPQPTYQPPVPTYQPPVPTPKPAAVAPQPAYQPPAPTYQPPAQTPKPAAVAPQPAYQPPAPTYQPPASTSASETFTDNRDGKTYKTVVIGGNRWMAENLNYNKGKSWCYGNDDSNCDKYGRLYDWKTAKTICPAGYHLPSRQEWNNLVTTAGDSSVAGKKLKSTSGWIHDGNGTNSYGFSALPGGGRYGTFGNIRYNGNWWTATEYGGGHAYRRNMLYSHDRVSEDYYTKRDGYSVRCVQD